MKVDSGNAIAPAARDKFRLSSNDPDSGNASESKSLQNTLGMMPTKIDTKLIKTTLSRAESTNPSHVINPAQPSQGAKGKRRATHKSASGYVHQGAPANSGSTTRSTSPMKIPQVSGTNLQLLFLSNCTLMTPSSGRLSAITPYGLLLMIFKTLLIDFFQFQTLTHQYRACQSALNEISYPTLNCTFKTLLMSLRFELLPEVSF